MEKKSLSVLEGRLPLIKSEWLARLRDEPVLSPLGRGETVVFLVDATMMQLMEGLRPNAGIPWLKQCVAVIAPVHTYLACGARAMRRYFAAGEEALRVGAVDALGMEFAEVLLAFQALAQHELEVLCRMCQHPGVPPCELRKKDGPDKPSLP